MPRRSRRKPKPKSPELKDLEIGLRIRAQRLLASLSQTDLAKAIGVSGPGLFQGAAIEKGVYGSEVHQQASKLCQPTLPSGPRNSLWMASVSSNSNWVLRRSKN